MALKRPDRVMALHLNFILGEPADPADPLAGLTEHEKRALEWKEVYDARESGYRSIQGAKPQSLAYGLANSPAGLAAWIVEKFKTWSDCGDDIETSYSKDHLLENIMLYWVTGTINSAMRLYHEGGAAPNQAAARLPRVEVPISTSVPRAASKCCSPGSAASPSWVPPGMSLFSCFCQAKVVKRSQTHIVSPSMRLDP